MQGKMHLQRLVDRKQYQETDEEFLVSSTRGLGSDSKRSVGKQFSVKLAKKLPVHDLSSLSLPVIQNSLLFSNRSVLTNAGINDSLVSAGSTFDRNLDSHTTEFSMRHISKLNLKLSKLAGEEDSDNEDQQILPLLPKDPKKLPKEAEPDKPLLKKILPNSNVSIECEKDLRQYFKVPFSGYNFPLTINFNKKLLVKVFVSFEDSHPSETSAEFSFDLTHFQIMRKKPPAEYSDEKAAEKKSIYFCVKPECDFKTTVSVLFESKELRQVGAATFENHSKDFRINYREFQTFSEQYLINCDSFGYLSQKKERAILEMNKNLVGEFIERKRRRFADLKNKEEVRLSMAKVKSERIEKARLELVELRKQEREKVILMKRLVTEAVLQKMLDHTNTRNQLVHLYLLQVVLGMHELFQRRVLEKELRKKKFYAACVIANAVKKKKKAFEGSVLTVSVTGPKEGYYDIRINNLLAVAHGLHLFTRNSRIPAYERALTVTGALFGALKTRVCVLHHSTEMRRRVLNFQRAFRYWKLFKKVAIKVYSKLFEEVLDELHKVSQEYYFKKLEIRTIALIEDIPRIVEAFLEHQIYSELVDRYRLVDRPYKEFGSLLQHVQRFKLDQHLEFAAANKKEVLLHYPNCVDLVRLDKLRLDFAYNEISGYDHPLKSKGKENDLKRLKSIFVLVGPKFAPHRFHFDFDDIDAKLFLVSLAGVTKPEETTEVFNVLFRPIPSSLDASHLNSEVVSPVLRKQPSSSKGLY